MITANDWKQTGKVFLWRYKDESKRFSGWHITADREGARSFGSLLDAFLHSNTDARRTILLSVPTKRELRVPNCNKKADPAERLVLEFVTKENSCWSLSGDDQETILRVGRSNLLNLRNGLTDIEDGKGDYCIGEEGQELWFWWRLNA